MSLTIPPSGGVAAALEETNPDETGAAGVPESGETTVVQAPGAARGMGRRGLLMIAGAAGGALLVGGAGGYLAGRVAGAPYVAGDGHVAFGYDDGPTGPTQWGQLDPHSAACGVGSEQSPIDITPRRRLEVDWLEPVKVAYKPSKARVVHTGYTFQVNYEPGSKMTFQGRDYQLVQFHFHTPSEHLINGKASDMELHLVHQSPDGALGVLGVLMNAGAENPLLARFWHQMPDKPGKEIATQITLDATEVLPQGRDFWTYGGSLTTPPCSERVTWVLMKEPVQASRAQISRFSEVFTKNARPVQSLKDRYVLEKAAPTL